MITYKDMTFCKADYCLNVGCERHLDNVPNEIDLPLALADFWDSCDERIEPPDVE